MEEPIRRIRMGGDKNEKSSPSNNKCHSEEFYKILNTYSLNSPVSKESSMRSSLMTQSL
jgi:hypothetical protein